MTHKLIHETETDSEIEKRLEGEGGRIGSLRFAHADLKKEMATHSSIFAWKIPWTDEPDYSSWCLKSWT